ncbi:MAG: CobD/CbiB family protein [Burkholderiaceae bacterium]|jgi:adenosylcobinamide-phosphate synthase|nr:CobD/CbiB family protein [Burkholderiaceae bacterium]
MSFIAILCALLIEQVRPLGQNNPVYAQLTGWVRWVSRNIDTGAPRHAGLAWALAVGVPSVLTLAVYWLLREPFGRALGLPLGVLWSVAVLYTTLGFRQFSHHYTAIRDALDANEQDNARTLLARWKHVDAANLPRSEIVRHVIEYSVIQAHRHVFGVFVWYAIFAALGFGPAGAVFYRMSAFVADYWEHKRDAMHQPSSNAVCAAAQGAWQLIDWLPARITALGFAIVGSFEDAIGCWRQCASNFPGNRNDGVILAATAGAVNVRLGPVLARPERRAPAVSGGLAGGPAIEDSAIEDPTIENSASSPASSAAPCAAGNIPEPAHLRSVVGLVWRSVVLWMALLALLTLAHLLG